MGFMKKVVLAQKISGRVMRTFESRAKFCLRRSKKLPVRHRNQFCKYQFFSKKRSSSQNASRHIKCFFDGPPDQKQILAPKLFLPISKNTHEKKTTCIKALWSSKDSSEHLECNFEKIGWEKSLKSQKLETLASISKYKFAINFVFGKKCFRRHVLSIFDNLAQSSLQNREEPSLKNSKNNK